jgi:hypothetical protein
MRNPMSDDTAVLRPMGDKPMGDEPAGDKPMGDEPAGDEPAGDEPVDGRDGLAAELAAAAPRRWWNRGTLVLGVIVLVMAGFLGGLQVQKHFGAEATTAAGQNGRPAGFPGGGGFGGQGRAGNASAAPGGAAPGGAAPAAGTNGTVKLVDGTTIYVQTPDGTVVTVRTGKSTDVRTATKATVQDVKAGDTVTVQGAADAEGTVTATTVTRSGK